MDVAARLAQINEKTLSQYERYDSAQKRVDERTGTKHGKAGIPAADEDRHPFRDDIAAAARSELNRHQALVQDLELELKSREDELLRERDDVYPEKRAKVKEEFDQLFDGVERTHGNKSHRFQGLKDAYERARQHETELSAELGRPLRVSMRAAYPVLMLIIAIAEVPINKFAFELFFEESPMLSLLIALVLGGVFVLFAHFMGTWIRRSTGHRRFTQMIPYYLGALLISGLIAPMFYVLAMLREHYVHFIEQTSTSFSQMLQQDGIREVASNVLSAELTTTGLTLLLFNVVVFAIGVVLAFARHDPHPDYEHITSTREKLEKRFMAAKKTFDRKFNAIAEDRNKRMQYFETQLDRVSKELTELEKGRALCAAVRRHALQTVVLNIRQRLQAYEISNRQARADTTLPQVFNRYDERTIEHEVRAEVLGFPGGDGGGHLRSTG
ncbi:MAG: hypothetical protein ACPGUC_00355 [Gammaproteobacteria bacterium]